MAASLNEVGEIGSNIDDIVQNIQNYNRDEIVTLMKESIDVMAAVCLPDVCTEYFPPEYQYLWKEYTSRLLDESRAFPKRGLGLPRGHGKTMFIKLLIMFTVLFTSRRYILVVCASDTLAEDIIVDVGDILDSANIQALFGNWRKTQERDKIGYYKFNFCGYDRILKGLGQNASFRGTNIKNRRPDFMIFDDAQTLDCAMSPATAQKFQRKFFGTMLKAKDPKRCFYLYVGNMYQNVVIERNERTGATIYGCLLRVLKDSPSWETIIVGAILENGAALWEEVQPLEQLLAEFEDDFHSGNAHSFAAEVLNDPDYSLLKLFDPGQVPAYPHQLEEDDLFFPIAKFIVVDPSLGKKKSDDQILTEFRVYDEVPVAVTIKNCQKSSPEMAKELITWAMNEGIKVIAIENYAMQGVIIQWIQFWLQQVHCKDIKIVPINRGAQTKVSGIIGMFKELMAGELYLHPEIKAKVYDQIMEFNPVKQDNRDDILDTLAYGNRVWLEYGELCFIEHLKKTFDDDPDEAGVVDAGIRIGVS